MRHGRAGIASAVQLNRGRLISMARKGGATQMKGHWTDQRHEADGTDRNWVQTTKENKSHGVDLLRYELNTTSWQEAWDDVTGR